MALSQMTARQTGQIVAETLRQPVVTEGLHSQLPFCAPRGHEDGEELQQMRRPTRLHDVLCRSIVVRLHK